MASFTAALKQWVIDTYQTKMGEDDNYVTDAEKAALHSHANKTELDQVSGINTGDQDLSGLVPNTRTVNSKPLSVNVTLDAADVGADPAGTAAGLVGALAIPDSADDVGAIPEPAVEGAPGDVLVTDGAGGRTWATPDAGGVTSVDGQTGDVSLSSTYEATARRVSNVLPGSTFQGAFDAGTTYAVGDVVAHDGGTYLARPLLGAQTWADTTRTNHNTNPTMRNDSRLGWTLGTNLTDSFPVADSVTLTATADKTVNQSLMQATTGTTSTDTQVWSAAFLVTVPSDAPNSVSVLAAIADSTGMVQRGTAVTIAPGESARVKVEGKTGRAGTTWVKAQLANGGTNPSGSVLQVSQTILEKSATIGSYFDGASTGVNRSLSYWTGTADNSTSVEVTSTPSRGATPTRGVPGVDLTGWAAVNLDGGATPRIPTETDVHMVGPARGPYGAIACDRVDRTTFISGDLNGAHALQYSRDDCETWATAHTFDDAIASGTILDNGEALVATRVTGAGNTDPWKLYLSTGFRADPTTATWALVHTGTTLQGAQPTRMSYSHHENVVVVGEYGPKIGTAGATDAARYVYLSRDYGQTWTLIYDLLDNPDLASTTGIHLHGVAYDPYWDRIWVTYGDAENGTVFSDDFGATWHTAHHSSYVSGQHQVVGILPMPKCVLFGSDGPPNGVSRIDRSQGKHDGEYTMTAAYQLDESSSITILCQSVWRARRLGDDAPGVLAFTAGETGPGPWRVLVTPDGYTWHEAWTDDTDTQANAPGTAFGPTSSGGIVLHTQDGRFSTNWTMWRGDMPGAY